MGTPASSALRADNATNAAALSGTNGDSFGSLTGLGGPKKFKKKPVLVLDPEELERAHMMFQEASAELLGEEVERAPKPAAATLGLAPMDDEDATPEDMGHIDDVVDGDDDAAIPTAEDLLKMTSSRQVEDEEEQEFAMRALEEGFDEEHRIFPTLPVLPEEAIAFEEAAEMAASEPDLLPEAQLPEAGTETAHEAAITRNAGFKLSPLSAGDSEAEEEDEETEASGHFASLSPQIRRETPVQLPEPAETAEEPAPEPEPEPVAAEAEEREPMPELEPEPEADLEPAPQPLPEPEQLEVDPWNNEPAPIPEEVAPLPAAEDHWEAEPASEPEPVAKPESEPEAAAAHEPTPRIENAPEDLPASPHIAPFEHQRAVKPVEEQDPVRGFQEAPLPPTASAPEPRDEQPPIEHEAAEPEAVEPPQADTPPAEPEYVEPPRPFVADDGPRWQPESYDAPEETADEDEALPEPVLDAEADKEHFAASEEASDKYTVIEDEPVDGYAFMHTANPRGRAIRAAAPGEANSLRARLIREREELQAQESASDSVFARFWNWLRGLFG